MANLRRASDELFNRTPDECHDSLQSLWELCQREKEKSSDRWVQPSGVELQDNHGRLFLDAGSDGAFALNNWSFIQLCRLAGVAKDTVNRLSSDTASRVLRETLPREGTKPFQLFTQNDLQMLRSVHGTQYTRLWDADVVTMLREFAVDFQPPQKGFNGATGLYRGEEDMFCFLIDPNGWAEINGDAFAPGFFIWNSETGRRSLGIQTFWFQAICQNHIVWDAIEVVEFTRKHTANVREGLTEIRRIIEGLVEKRDARKDGFVEMVRKAMEAKLGQDAEDCLKVLSGQGIPQKAGKAALEIAAQKGSFTIWSVVDALTRMAREQINAGDRTDADFRAASLLQLV